MPINITLPTNATAIGMLEWTNTIVGTNWGVSIWLVFFSFVLPLAYFISIGQDKLEATIISSLFGATCVIIMSMAGLVGEFIFVALLGILFISAIYHNWIYGK